MIKKLLWGLFSFFFLTVLLFNLTSYISWDKESDNMLFIASPIIAFILSIVIVRVFIGPLHRPQGD
jgi:hypothetical protein